MKGKKVVIALGGNAILQPGQKGTFQEQQKNVHTTCLQMIEMVKKGYKIIVTHGNGPQVGNILIQNEEASSKVPPMPLYVCGAMSQGMIGYMIQQTLKNELSSLGIHRQVLSVVTQVVVDQGDMAFKNPSKPIGPFYDQKKAEQAMVEKGETWIEDSGRGFRKVVASPDPIKIVESQVIQNLVDNGVIVIASGGGGIPVIEKTPGIYEGIEAVIDKDFAGERLAVEVGAHLFMILTDVPKVAIHYREENETWLDSLCLTEAEEYMALGHFKKGSMGPKVKACMRFVEDTGYPAVITSLDSAVKSLEGHGGTMIQAENSSSLNAIGG